MNRIFTGDALTILKGMPAETVQTCVTSPPYFGLRDYGVKGQIGLEATPEHFVQKLVEVFREVRRVLKKNGTLWLNLGDSYATGAKGGHKSKPGDKNFTSKGTVDQPLRTYDYGVKQKDLIGIPWRVAFALQADGWYLRQDIIWHKPNPMPESVTDRCTKAHEYIFLLSKSQGYYFDADTIKEPVSGNTHLAISKRKVEAIKAARAAGANTSFGSGRKSAKTHKVDGMVKQNESFHNAVCLPVEKRNRRSVWTVGTKPYRGAHFATFPPDLIKPCILASSPPDGVVLDPFLGSGTTAAVAQHFGRSYVGIELNPEYVRLAEQRLACFKSAVRITTTENQQENLRQQFARLRQQTHRSMKDEEKVRLKENPRPTEEELYMGAFKEWLEPQVRSAVAEMNTKGYATLSSGFHGEEFELQMIDGYFVIDKEAKKALREMEVEVLRGADVGVPGNKLITIIRFRARQPSLDAIKADWDAVAATLPVKKLPEGVRPICDRAEIFRQEYASAHPSLGEARDKYFEYLRTTTAI